MSRPNTPDQFWQRVTKAPDDGCWEWAGYRDEFGYGRLKYAGRSWGAHRLSWTLTHGPIPQGLHMLHRCDNPPCVRPDHLFVGTAKDNIHDAAHKGRWHLPTNSVNPTRLDADKVRAIRQLAQTGMGNPAIAARYGVSRRMVYGILAGETWKGVA